MSRDTQGLGQATEKCSMPYFDTQIGLTGNSYDHDTRKAHATFIFLHGHIV